MRQLIRLEIRRRGKKSFTSLTFHFNGIQSNFLIQPTPFPWRHDIQHDDTQINDTQHNLP
jgi:hypothetical protein